MTADLLQDCRLAPPHDSVGPAPEGPLIDPKNPRAWWLGLYLAINIACTWLILRDGMLLGETSGFRLLDRTLVLPALLAVGLAYIGVLGFVFPRLAALPVRPRPELTRIAGRPIGWMLLALQFAFIALVLVTGAFRAGSTERLGGVLSAFWVLVNVDTLFFIYYGFYRESPLFMPNLAAAVVSSMLRGWSGIFLLIAFMETARWIRAGKLTTARLAAALLVLALAYPLVYAIKLQVRLQAVGGDTISIVEIARGVATSLSAEDIGTLTADASLQVVERLHLVSNTIAVVQQRHALLADVERGDVAPFWLEGLHGVAIDRLTGHEPRPDIGAALAQRIDPLAEDVNWNSNPGLWGWPALLPELTPVYLAWIGVLMVVPIALGLRLAASVLAMDMLWFAMFNYIVPGWIGSAVLFMHTMLIFYATHVVLVRWRRRAVSAPAVTRVRSAP